MTTNVWTVNDEDKMRDVIEREIMYITTDYPLEARKVMEEAGMKEVK